MKPPSGGPISGAVSPGHVSRAIARISPAFSVPRSTTSRPIGTIIAPPTPCRTRAATKLAGDHAKAHNPEAAVKITIADANTARPPYRSAAHPPGRIITATVSRYAEIPTCKSTAVDPSAAAICGSAGAMIVPSRNSMKKHPATSSDSGFIPPSIERTRPGASPPGRRFAYSAACASVPSIVG